MGKADISGHCPESNGTCPNGNGTCPDGAPTATDVLRAIDQLRRDLTGYHGQLKAYNDLQRHCDNQRKRIAELEGLYAKAKAENAKLRELVRDMWRDGMCECDELFSGCQPCEYHYPELMRELGVEVEA